MYNMKVYDAAAEGERKITEHFKVREFQCSDGSRPVYISQTLADLLEAIRQRIRRPLRISSGYRTVSYNATVKGSSKTSKHCMGLAADVKADGIEPRQLYNIACELLGDHGGVGLYSWGVHVDVRAEKSRWHG